MKIETTRTTGRYREMTGVLVALVVLVVLGLIGRAPLFADTLVLLDGTTIETRGPWKERGKTVVFTDQRGTLSSLRASEVDLEATARANQPKVKAAPEPEKPAAARTPVLVLTDDDIAPATASPGAPAMPAESAAEDAAGTTIGVSGDVSSDATTPVDTASDPALANDTPNEATAGAGSVFVAAEGLVLRDWRVNDSGSIGELELAGSVVNRGPNLIVDVAISARVAGREGEETYIGFVGTPALGPGQVTAFRIPLPDVVSAPEEPTFDLSGRGLRPRIVGSGAEPSDEGTAKEDPSGSSSNR